jgi:hypothetical protein
MAAALIIWSEQQQPLCLKNQTRSKDPENERININDSRPINREQLHVIPLLGAVQFFEVLLEYCLVFCHEQCTNGLVIAPAVMLPLTEQPGDYLPIWRTP